MLVSVWSRWWSVAVVAIVVAAGYAVSRVPVDRPVVPTALAVLPADTTTANITDWAAVREQVGEDLDAAYRGDYSAVSLLVGSAEPMEQHYGWSVHDLSWESFGQSDRGAGAVVQLDDEVDVDLVRSRLRELGYDEPAASDGVWTGGDTLVASIDPALTPMLSHVAVRADARQVVLSDRAPYARRVARAAAGEVRAVGTEPPVRAVGLQLREAVAGTVHVGRRGCELMGFARASADDKARARQRVAAVGGVRRHAAVGWAKTVGSDGTWMLLALDFASEVSGEAQARAALARGEAVGQGGTFEDRFRVRAVETSGRTVVLDLEPTQEDAQLLSDLGRGAFLPAVCG